MLSEAFRLALLKFRINGGRMYTLAIRAGISPSLFSAMVNGAKRVALNDPRIVRIGAELGLKAEDCFQTRTDIRIE